MSHNRGGIIINSLLPIFAEPHVRERLAVHQCAKIDAMASQTEFSDKDVKYILRALETALDD